jgi:hypothetical protein
MGGITMKTRQIFPKILAMLLVGVMLVGVVPMNTLAFGSETTANTAEIAFAPEQIGDENVSVTAFVPRQQYVLIGGRTAIIELEVSLTDSADGVVLLYYEILRNGSVINAESFPAEMILHEESGDSEFVFANTFDVYDISHVVENVQSEDFGEYSITIHYTMGNNENVLSIGSFVLSLGEINFEDEEDESELTRIYYDPEWVFDDEENFSHGADGFVGIAPLSTTIRVPDPANTWTTHAQQLRNALTNTTANRVIEITADIPLSSWTPVNISGNAARFTINGNGHILSLTATTSQPSTMTFVSGLLGMVSTSGTITPDITINDLGINQASTTARTTLGSSQRQLHAGGMIDRFRFFVNYPNPHFVKPVCVYRCYVNIKML